LRSSGNKHFALCVQTIDQLVLVSQLALQAIQLKSIAGLSAMKNAGKMVDPQDQKSQDDSEHPCRVSEQPRHCFGSFVG